MRSTGEVMASAADFPTAFAKAERAAGRPLPSSGRAFLSVADADKEAAVALAERPRRARASACSRPAAPPQRSPGRGSRSRAVRKVSEEGEGADGRRSHPARALRPRPQHAGRQRRALGRLHDPRGRAGRAGPVRDDDGRRRAPPSPRSPARGTSRRCPCRSALQRSRASVRARRRGRAVRAARASSAAGSIPGEPGPVLHALAARPGAAAADEPLPRAARRAGVPHRPDRPGDAGARRAARRRRAGRARPARPRLPPRRRAAAARRRRHRDRAASVPRRAPRRRAGACSASATSASPRRRALLPGAEVVRRADAT